MARTPDTAKNPQSANPTLEQKRQMAEKFGQSPDQVRRSESEGYSSLDEQMSSRSAASEGSRPDPRVNESRKNLGQQDELEDSRLIQEEDRMDDKEDSGNELNTSVSQRPNERR